MRILLPPRHVLLQLHFYQTTGHPLVESTKGPTYSGICHPGLRPKQDSRGLPPPAPKSWKMYPSTPSLLNIINHRRTVIIRCGKVLSKVFKVRHRLHMSPVVPEGHYRDLMRLLLPHPIEFTICPLCAHHCRIMLPVHWHPGGGGVSHLGHPRMGWLPYSRNTHMSRKRRYTKLNMRELQLVALHGHPQLAMWCHVMSKGSRTNTSWLHTGGDVGSISGIPGPPYAVSADGSPGNLLPGPHCTQGSGPAGRVYSGKWDPLLSSWGRRPPRSAPLLCNRVGTP